MSGTVTPKTMYNREGFKMLGTEGKEGLGECKGGMDDKVEGYYGNPRFLMKPLEVVFSSYLERSRFCKGEIGGGLIEGAMMKLFVRKVRMECSKLPIRPPVLLCGKGVDKVGGTGGEGTLQILRELLTLRV